MQVIKLLTRLRSNFSDLNEHKFRHIVSNTITTMCNFSAYIKATNHYLLHLPLHFPNSVYKLDYTHTHTNTHTHTHTHTHRYIYIYIPMFQASPRI